MSGEQDEEEVPALVLEENSDHTAAVASAGQPRPSLSTVLPTRGVASVMAGLVFLALLVGFVRWIKLDNVSITLAIYFALQCSMPFKKKLNKKVEIHAHLAYAMPLKCGMKGVKKLHPCWCTMYINRATNFRGRNWLLRQNND
jgi:hypothetical protein